MSSAESPLLTELTSMTGTLLVGGAVLAAVAVATSPSPLGTAIGAAVMTAIYGAITWWFHRSREETRWRSLPEADPPFEEGGTRALLRGLFFGLFLIAVMSVMLLAYLLVFGQDSNPWIIAGIVLGSALSTGLRARSLRAWQTEAGRSVYTRAGAGWSSRRPDRRDAPGLVVVPRIG